MSDVADSTIAFSSYGLLCSATKPVTQDALLGALGKAGMPCDQEQFDRTIASMLTRGWLTDTDGGQVSLSDPGHWLPCFRDRTDAATEENPEEYAGWQGWMVRGPNGEVVTIADRLAFLGDLQ